MPWLWDLVDAFNSWLFSLRYGRRLKDIEPKVMEKYVSETGYEICRMREVDASQLADFFAVQPEEAYKYFKPHKFDVASIKKLQRNKSFLAYLVLDEGKIAGYCFNRSFFHGRGFRGTIVDSNCQGKGIGTLMKKILNDVGFGIGLRLFETVAKDNVASYRSSVNSGNVKLVKELPHDELFLEIVQP